MSLAQPSDRLQLPESLHEQLHAFRRRLWNIKVIEAACGAVIGVILAVLILFALDRVFETPAWARVVIFGCAVSACSMVPIALHRWVWCHRRFEQLAKLVARSLPSVGDQLLGVIELVRNDAEQARSRELCEAAIRQVAEDSKRRDFNLAIPTPRHRVRGMIAAAFVMCIAVLWVMFPAAIANAWARMWNPWSATPRFTFASFQPLPEELVVPHGEPFTIVNTLKDDTIWHPQQGTVEIPHHRPIAANLRDGVYNYDMPSLIEPIDLTIRTGDAIQRMRIVPTLRPELTSIEAQVDLPKYLGRELPVKKDVRGGAVSFVKGSHASFAAKVSRDLAEAKVDGQSQTPSGGTIKSPVVSVEKSHRVEFRWKDRFGLEGREPFGLNVHANDDEAPSIICEELPRQRVLLDSEQLSFKVRAQDDFGVKQVGMEWKGLDNSPEVTPSNGERILAAGAVDKETMELGGTFQAKSLGITPQPIQLRLFVEDYFPDRERVYSPAYTFFVLDAEQHAIWLTEQLSKWHRQSLEVRDREMALFETNKQLRALPAEEIDRPEVRRRIETQAMAERGNGRRLSSLVETGEDLVQQATRNPEFGVGHLEKWSEMLQILKDISGNRMPSVADLLKDASQAPKVASSGKKDDSKTAGKVRATGGGEVSGSPEDKKDEISKTARITDVESTQQPKDKDEVASNDQKKSGTPTLRLPQTLLMGNAKGGESCPAGDKVEEAVQAQSDLLAEFERISDELNKVLANLEGSTLVKRLKAASREQYAIGGRLGDQINQTFGKGAIGDAARVIGELSEAEAKSSKTVSAIVDDMHAYFERRKFVQFKNVLDDMRKQDVVGNLRVLGDDIRKEQGLSLAQTEYWSDNLDRWAEDLVDPASGGT